MARILAIIPAHNEEKNIGKVVSATISQVDEVLVVDDGSIDRTASLARLAGAKVAMLPVNLGYGAALETGYRYALRKGFDAIVQLDADGQHDPASISRLIEPVSSGNADVAIGSRFLEPESSYKPGTVRMAGIQFFSWLTERFTGDRLTDPTSGYQALSRHALQFIVDTGFPDDFPDADVIVSMKRAGVKILEVSVSMSEREDGKGMHSGIKPIYYVFKITLSMCLNLIRKAPKFEKYG